MGIENMGAAPGPMRSEGVGNTSYQKLEVEINKIYTKIESCKENSYEIDVFGIKTALKSNLFARKEGSNIFNNISENANSQLKSIAWTLSSVGESQELMALIDLGLPADLVNTKTELTFLIEAVMNEDEKLVKFLKENGANLGYVNSLGSSARSIADLNGYVAILEILDS